ncbi:hypothetical protein [Geodermatophilus ruber]|uniref:Uncharacterized protein n=1 Tax=Geodermatophilus ruber TaxID=504800 RepID=A0A1I4K576_9ACTN|nr:hypothetical protein [Geodermatophilus ruber]SFL73894.1 hypothetical protein SAMN04488085_116105 [Geodermatophilus ruber]
MGTAPGYAADADVPSASGADRALAPEFIAAATGPLGIERDRYVDG